jgi:[protein-PII] uridylyltransferase
MHSSSELDIDFVGGRAALLADTALQGRHFSDAYRTLTDAWLAQLFERAAGDQQGVALLAVGGYGRGELCPGSDLDVLLLHAPKTDVAKLAERIWYPIWDAKVHLGHAVRTVKEALSLAADDLDTATALLDARLIAGDAQLADALYSGARASWTKRSRKWFGALKASVDERSTRAGEVAFLLEPDLKLGRGGLRDVHTLRWAETARPVLFHGDADALDEAYDELLAVRIELQRTSGQRGGDVLLLQDQDAVAKALGDADADVLMSRVAAAAKTIAWTVDDVWWWAEGAPSSKRGADGRALSAGIVLKGGAVELTPDAWPADDPTLVLRLAAAAATNHTRISRASLQRLADEARPYPDPWPLGARGALVDLLRAGHWAIAVIEALDHVDVWTRVLPEWEPVRSRPQRNAYHRYTVDRHLLETVANAARLADRVERSDLLLVGALLHDLGKGYPGDHTDAGVELVLQLGPRLGFPADDVAVLISLVRNHLLLPDVATRRDLDDAATIDWVVSEVGTAATLELLAALTEADSLATGPSAWSAWKAELVDELVHRALHVMAGGSMHEVARTDFPTPEQLAALRAGVTEVVAGADTLTVVAPDRPGLFSRVAGVLVLNGLDVLSAGALSSDTGMALEHFRVAPSFHVGELGIDWGRVRTDIEKALAGRLAIDARVSERARTYRPRRAKTTAKAEPPRVIFDESASASATVMEVHAPDGIGVLYRITRALADFDLDIRTAKVQTQGASVLDAFYLLDADGNRLTDPAHLAEVERAVLHALDRH